MTYSLPNREFSVVVPEPSEEVKKILEEGPKLGPNGELLGADGKPLLGPNGELLGIFRTMKFRTFKSRSIIFRTIKF
jgi:hypothetical protein